MRVALLIYLLSLLILELSEATIFQAKTETTSDTKVSPLPQTGGQQELFNFNAIGFGDRDNELKIKEFERKHWGGKRSRSPAHRPIHVHRRSENSWLNNGWVKRDSGHVTRKKMDETFESPVAMRQFEYLPPSFTLLTTRKRPLVSSNSNSLLTIEIEPQDMGDVNNNQQEPRLSLEANSNFNNYPKLDDETDGTSNYLARFARAKP